MTSSRCTRLLFLTGSPGIGKTTILLKIVEALAASGYSVGGMISREVRSCGTRVGFEILDLSSPRHGWLAHINQKTGPQVGRYRVNLEDLDSIGVDAILKSVENADVIAIDEIGTMELFSERFRKAVRTAVESRKLVIGVVHRRASDRLIDELKAREDCEIHEVRNDNRDSLCGRVLRKAIKSLENKAL